MSYETNKWATDDLITHQKLNNIEDGVTMALEKVVYGTGGAQVPSEGHHTTIWLNEGDPMPGNPTVTDVVYVKNGDDYIIYEWDGSAWAVRLDPRIGERVDTAIKEAKEYSDNLAIENGTEVNNTINEVKTEQENLQKGLDQLDTKAQDYANKALTDARADIATTAQDLTKKVKQETDDRVKAVSDATTHADNIVATAKSDLANTIAKETSDRNAAVTALDTKAKGYANTAKADAISASATALNTAKTELITGLNKEVTDRTKAVSDLDTKAQGYADTAKTDAIATANGVVAKEVTDRQKAITDLDAKATGAINQAKTDAQSALDALQVGGRNYVLNSNGLSGSSASKPTLKGATSSSNVLITYLADGILLTNPTTHLSGEWLYQFANDWTPFTNTPLTPGNTFSFSADVMGTVPQVALRVGFNGASGSTQTSKVFTIDNTNWTRVSYTITSSSSHTGLYFRLNAAKNGQISTTWIGGETLKFRNVKIEIGSKATDYTQAPEDIVLDYTTKDNVINQSLTQYQATNDGNVSKAQSDATQALGLVATKVSQTDYNAKTGDLDSKYTAVKQTADQASTDIIAIKSDNKSQDTKINTLTSDVNGTKQSISDIQTEQGKQSTKINTIQTDVSGSKQDISDIKDANGVQDGKIASISTTVDGLSSSFSTYKTTNDGKVAKAQADITANSTAISQKVSQTAYDAKTGQLQTDLNTTTTTANQAKTDIVAIKKTNTDQDTRMTTIESDANGVKTTVSSLQTTQNTQAGSISTLQQRADGFDATVTKVNNLSVGGRNLLLHTNTNAYSGLNPGNGVYTTKYVPFDGGYKYQFTYTTPSTNWAVYMFWGLKKDKFEPDTDYVLSFMANFTSDVTPSVAFSALSTQHNFVRQITKPKVTGGSDQRVVIQLHTDPTIPTESDQGLYMGNFQYAGAGTFTIWDLKIEKGNLASSYTPAPEDVDSTIAKAQLTADNASLALSNYKTDADGRISKAQSDIVVNANAITQKVSQTEYNAKTGDLTTKVNTAQSTADSAKSTISAYQTSNDGRVATAESNITQNTKAIATKVSQTVYDAKTNQLQTDLNTTTTTANKATTDIVSINQKDTAQDARMTTIESDASGVKTTVSNLQSDLGKTNGSISTLQQRADGFDATVTKVNNLSIGGRNLLLKSKALFGVANNGNSSTNVTFDDTTNMWHITSPAPVTAGRGIYFYQTSNTSKPLVKGDKWAMSIDIKGTGMLREFGAEGSTNQTQPTGPIPSEWTRLSSTGTAVSTGAIIIYFGAGADKTQALDVYVKLPKLELGTIATAWSPAPEDLEGATAKAQLTADNATTTINNYKTSNDGRVATAESNISQNATAITQKVSQTDYNQKTGQLQTDLNTTTNTANTAKQDISTIKNDNTKRDEKINTLESDSTETKRTISQLSGDLSTVSGDVSTLKQTAQGFEATVTKVNNMSVGGGVNLLQGTGTVSGDVSQGGGALTKGAFNGYDAVKTNTAWNERYINLKSALGRTNTKAGDWYTISVYVKADKQIDTGSLGVYRALGSVDANTNDGGLYGISMSNKPITTQWQQYSWSFQINNVSLQRQSTRVEYNNDTSDNWIYWAGWVLEKGIVAHDWSPAPGDVDSSISSVKQTADSASTAITNYKTSNDGRVSAAEGAIKTNADAITQKVSKIDYDQKTGELSGKISEVSQTSDRISQSVSDVNGRIDNISVGGRNYVLDSHTSISGSATQKMGFKSSVPTSNFSGQYLVVSVQVDYDNITALTAGQNNRLGFEVVLRTTAGQNIWAGIWKRPQLGESFHGRITNGYVFKTTQFADNDGNSLIGGIYIQGVQGTNVTVSDPKLELGNMPTAWSPAPEDTDNKISTVSQTVRDITSIVSDPATGLSKRVQTAEGTLSQVTGADIPALQKATFWQAPNGYDLNTYLTQGSFFFNNTNARTNNPKADNGWMYLVVEQANGGSRVTQTAWYDSVTSAKVTYKRQYTSGTWGAWYANDNDSVASIAQTNGAIQTEISNRQTGDTNTLTQAQNFTTSAITNSESGTKSLITQTSNAIIANLGATNLFPNSEFEKDYGYRKIDGTTTLSLTNKDLIGSNYNGTVTTTSTSAGYQGYWARDIEVQGGQHYSLSVLVHYTNNSLANGKAVLDVWFVDKAGARISWGTIGSGGTNASQTAQVASPYWVKLYLENLIAPDAAVGMQVSLLNNSAGAGQKAIFTQPMVTATEKLQPYTPNNDITTQLALMKDNWSIGINDNTGKLASGIAGDANAMAVVSPKVIINSPQTQITGKLAAAQIDTKELSAISAVLGNVSSGSITNPISGQRSGHSNATIAGKTVIDAGGINMTADMLVGGSKVNSEQLQFSPDTGIIFKWNNVQGNVVRNTTVDEYGVTVSSGGPYTAGFSEMGFDIGNNVGGNAQVGIGGVYSTEFQRYRQSFSGQNLEIKLDFVRQGNLVMVNTNIVTYGPTLQGDAALMSGGKIPVGFRPVFPVDMVLNANTSGGQQSGIVISLDIDGKVYKTGPAWGGVMRVMGHTMYMTFAVGPSTQNYTAVSDGYGNITP